MGSDGFRAQAGAHVSLALEGHAYDWAYTPVDDGQRPVTHGLASRGPAGGLLLTGIALPFSRPQYAVDTDWVLDLDGVPILITSCGDTPQAGEQDDLNANNVASSPDHFAPTSNRWVTVRGALRVADEFVADEAESILQRPVKRSWLVQRIVPIESYGHGRGRKPELRVQPPTESIRFTGTNTSYLIDLLGPRR